MGIQHIFSESTLNVFTKILDDFSRELGDNGVPQKLVLKLDALDSSVIRSAALHTTGAADPSGLDARCWRRLCTTFHSTSSKLCIPIAWFARRICSSFVSPDILAPFVACRLNALEKQPGVQPIGVCEVVRRLVYKAVLSIIREDIMVASGPPQLCAGQTASVEAAIHPVCELFVHNDYDAVLMVDASNAFNSLNRIVALHNVRQICPPFGTVLINVY